MEDHRSIDDTTADASWRIGRRRHRDKAHLAHKHRPGTYGKVSSVRPEGGPRPNFPPRIFGKRGSPVSGTRLDGDSLRKRCTVFGGERVLLHSIESRIERKHDGTYFDTHGGAQCGNQVTPDGDRVAGSDSLSPHAMQASKLGRTLKPPRRSPTARRDEPQTERRCTG